MSPRLFAFVLPVSDITQAERFYSRLLEQPGKRISPGRHSFFCEGLIITCYDANAEGAEQAAQPASSSTICLSVPDLDYTFECVKADQCMLLDEEIVRRPWGSRFFRLRDPFGNAINVVEETTMRQQISEHSTDVETPLHVGMEVSVHGLRPRGSTGTPARVDKIFPGQAWLTLIPTNGLRFGPGENVQIKFARNRKVFFCDSRVIEISPLGDHYIAVVVPKEADLMERRSAGRYPCDLPIRLLGLEHLTATAEETEARVLDISTGGVRMESPIPLAAGKQVELRLLLGEIGNVEASATVAWSESIQRNDVSTELIGLEFMKLSLDDEIKILQYLIDAQEKKADRR